MGEELTFKDGEDAAQNEIQERGFDLGLWNEFLEHPADFEALFSDVLIGKPKNFIAGYRSYYSSSTIHHALRTLRFTKASSRSNLRNTARYERYSCEGYYARFAD